MHLKQLIMNPLLRWTHKKERKEERKKDKNKKIERVRVKSVEGLPVKQITHAIMMNSLKLIDLLKFPKIFPILSMRWT